MTLFTNKDIDEIRDKKQFPEVAESLDKLASLVGKFVSEGAIKEMSKEAVEGGVSEQEIIKSIEVSISKNVKEFIISIDNLKKVVEDNTVTEWRVTLERDSYYNIKTLMFNAL